MKFTICDLRFTRGLQFSKRITNSGLTFLVLSLLLTSCEKRDSKIRQQLVGSWSREFGEITFDTTGTFHSQFGSAKKRLDFFGTWQVRNGILQCASTNIGDLLAVGSFDFTIIQVDAAQLILVGDGQTNVFVRK